MPSSRNLWIGFGASALVLGAVGAVAGGIDWDPRDVEAAERYREQETQRAERYRREAAGLPSPRTSERNDESAARRDEGLTARAQARAERREARAEWWSRTFEGVSASFDVEGMRESLEDWGLWWREEAAPAWEEWAAEQEARVDRPSDPGRDGAREPAPSVPLELPASVERILEDSLPPEEATALRRDAQQALDWWAEERERMRARFGDHEGR